MATEAEVIAGAGKSRRAANKGSMQELEKARKTLSCSIQNTVSA